MVDSRTVSHCDRHARAWLYLVAALGVHVLDEALTGFLDFYNPLILHIRERIGFWPVPALTLGVFLCGMIAAVAILGLLTPVVRRGAAGTAALSWVFAIIMLGNGFAHLAASLYYRRWVPGATSAPLVLIAATNLVKATMRTRHADTP
jgi:hypothetical protein